MRCYRVVPATSDDPFYEQPSKCTCAGNTSTEREIREHFVDIRQLASKLGAKVGCPENCVVSPCIFGHDI